MPGDVFVRAARPSDNPKLTRKEFDVNTQHGFPHGGRSRASSPVSALSRCRGAGAAGQPAGG